MDFLQQLPTELLLRITSFLPHASWYKRHEPPSALPFVTASEHLYNVCLVSRRFRGIG
ncbi:hypothetical protein BJX66DRAFT_306032 [Aspergillus keveii]|uniref:F-box domain-containing protein n=1 Tax=Aspergillus keveii TaxID=714993 RepID=A0ABR4G3B3_9EURO